MVKSRIIRRIEFDYGHRILGHEGKCRHLHGHRGACEITVEADSLDSVGRIIDFSVIKEVVGGWIMENWDHNMILHWKDPLIDHLRALGERKPCVMDCNPTSENLASFLFNFCVHKLPADIRVVQVRVYETPNCWADCYG